MPAPDYMLDVLDPLEQDAWIIVRSVDHPVSLYHRHGIWDLYAVHEGKCRECGEEPPAFAKFVAKTRKLGDQR